MRGERFGVGVHQQPLSDGGRGLLLRDGARAARQVEPVHARPDRPGRDQDDAAAQRLLGGDLGGEVGDISGVRRPAARVSVLVPTLMTILSRRRSDYSSVTQLRRLFFALDIVQGVFIEEVELGLADPHGVAFASRRVCAVC